MRKIALLSRFLMTRASLLLQVCSRTRHLGGILKDALPSESDLKIIDFSLSSSFAIGSSPIFAVLRFLIVPSKIDGMERLKLQDLDVDQKKVLVRVDFNVPLDSEGNITDDTRIKEALPTIQYIIDHGGSAILMSHLGRPKDKEERLSLKRVASRLSELFGKKVAFAGDCIGKEALNQAKALKSGDLLLLENLRFYSAEEHPNEDPEFAKKLAELGDLYVNDAFGTAHREHSSTAVIAKYFSGKAAAGLLMQKEIKALETLIKHPEHPFFAIIGGAKVSTKLGILISLLERVDALLIGGGMAYTFLKVQGIAIGDSLCEEKCLNDANKFLEESKKKGVKIYFPKDIIIANAFKDDAESKVIEIKNGIPDGWQGMDIGPATLENWKDILNKGKMIFWNGPLGVFEFPAFAKGTNTIAEFLSILRAKTVVGGGDSVAAINKLGISNNFYHISTGGGASLEFLEFGELPGINALSIKNQT